MNGPYDSEEDDVRIDLSDEGTTEEENENNNNQSIRNTTATTSSTVTNYLSEEDVEMQTEKQENNNSKPNENKKVNRENINNSQSDNEDISLHQRALSQFKEKVEQPNSDDEEIIPNLILSDDDEEEEKKKTNEPIQTILDEEMKDAIKQLSDQSLDDDSFTIQIEESDEEETKVPPNTSRQLSDQFMKDMQHYETYNNENQEEEESDDEAITIPDNYEETGETDEEEEEFVEIEDNVETDEEKHLAPILDKESDSDYVNLDASTLTNREVPEKPIKKKVKRKKQVLKPGNNSVLAKKVKLMNSVPKIAPIRRKKQPTARRPTTPKPVDLSTIPTTTAPKEPEIIEVEKVVEPTASLPEIKIPKRVMRKTPEILTTPVVRDERKQKRDAERQPTPPVSRISSGKTSLLDSNFMENSLKALNNLRVEEISNNDDRRVNKICGIRDRRFYNYLLKIEVGRDPNTNIRTTMLPQEETELVNVQDIPSSFSNVEQYCKIFSPHILHECVAQIRNNIASNNLESTNIKLIDYEITAIDSCLLYFTYVHDKNISLVPPSIALLEGPIGNNNNTLFYVLGEIQYNDSNKSNQLGIRLGGFLTIRIHSSTKDRIARALFKNSVWKLNKISLTPILRQMIAVNSFEKVDQQIIKTVLNPDKTVIVYRRGYPLKYNDLWDERKFKCNAMFKFFLKKNYNESQIESIMNGYEFPMEDKFLLIQGPPGTGKTRTILGLLSALTQKKIDFPPLRKRKILVCAPSNQAVDEVLRRVTTNKLITIQHEQASLYTPNVVRLGIKESVHSTVESYYIDAMCEEKLKESKNHKKRKLLENRLLQVQEDLRERLQTNRSYRSEINLLQREQNDIIEQLNNFPDDTQLSNTIKQEIIDSAEILFVTLASSGLDFDKWNLKIGEISHLIVDECCQCVEPEILIPIVNLCGEYTKYIFVGDPCQLPATVLSASRDYNFPRSLMERFMEKGYPAILLNVQHRMHNEICSFPSKYFYKGELFTSEKINPIEYGKMYRDCDSSLFKPIQVIDLLYSKEERANSSSSFRNLAEAKYVAYLYRQMVEKLGNFYSKSFNDYNDKIGIISGYKQQSKELRNLIFGHVNPLAKGKLDINTIDGFQGREKDIIIVSCVRSEGVGFLNDFRRMNVAITRAKYSLIVVCNSKELSNNDLWVKLIDDAKKRGCYSILSNEPSINLTPLHTISNNNNIQQRSYYKNYSNNNFY
ncbi:hypothetical protein ABK040_009639 [Willaertia magna]